MTTFKCSKTVILITLALTGCATTAPVRCVTQEQVDELKRQEPPKVKDRLTGKADEDLRVIGGSAIRLRQWGKGMLGVLEGCVGG